MIKRFAYIVLLLSAPCLISAKEINTRFGVHVITSNAANLVTDYMLTDTTKTKRQEREEKNKIKEIAKARRQPKPEKLDDGENLINKKPKPRQRRQRRPEGLERPPEIPRRNGN